MPKNNCNQNQGRIDDRANRSSRGSSLSGAMPFSGNYAPELPFVPLITPSIPAPEGQRGLPPYNGFNRPTAMIPVWSSSVDVANEVPKLAAQPLTQEQSNDDRQLTSPTLRRIHKMRLARQQRADAQLKRGTKIDDIVKTASKDGHKPFAKTTSDTEVSHTTQNTIPELNFADVDWAAPLYSLSNALAGALPVQTEGAGPEPVSRQRINAAEKSSDSSDEDINALVKAIANMQPFQRIASSPPKTHTRQIKSTVIAGSTQNKMPTQQNDDSNEMQDVLLNTTSVNEETSVPKDEGRVATLKNSGSVESFASAVSDDFERVELPKAEEVEHNGGKRKWYKGFRR